ncbi:hypothetical protein RB595_002521 [Gaeumannomyces hyphopodioides]
MDIPDLSAEPKWAANMRQLEEAAKKAQASKGQVPRYHIPARLRVMQFVINNEMTGAQVASFSHSMVTTVMPLAYPPCVLPVDSLRPIMIAEMQLETHHRGRYALVRVIAPSSRMTAVTTIVEDEQGTASMLQLYTQPPESDVPAAETMRMHRVAVLKEPFFKSTLAENAYNLRVDHVGDVVWLDEADPRVPHRWRVSRVVLGSQELRAQGNDAVKRCCFAEAERLYSAAILAAETAEEKKLALLNRSHANLKLARVEDALADAVAANQIGSPSEKGLFREGRALYELARFDECLARFQDLVCRFPENKAAGAESERTEARLREQNAGAFSFARMHRQARATPPVVDCATFLGPVEVRDSPGRGRGLFTTEKVKAGQLLVCEKAFGYSFVDDDDEGDRTTTVLMDFNTKRVTLGSQAHLIAQIAQRLSSNPRSSKAFEGLHKGDYQPVAGLGSEVDGKPVVDTFMVARVVSLNCFGAPRTSLDYHKRLIMASGGRASAKDLARDTSSCGFWVHASYINHSCVENCCRSYIGDVQIIRAATDLDAGAELVYRYFSPDDDRKAGAALHHWGFECGCALCAERRSATAPPPRAAAAVKAAAARASAAGHLDGPRLAEALRLLRRLEDDARPTPAALRDDVWTLCVAAGEGLQRAGRHAESLRCLVRGLECRGFVLDARPPSSVGAGSAVLEVKTWGRPGHRVIYVFLLLRDAFEKLAPELAGRADGYFRTAYCIMNGETETVVEFTRTHLEGGWLSIG